VQRLRELGWIEGRTVAIEVRWAEGRVEGLAEIAAEFVRLKVDVMVTSGTPAVVQAMQATSVIPIVSAVMGDPVATGLVASLARPGGNITGLSVLHRLDAERARCPPDPQRAQIHPRHNVGCRTSKRRKCSMR
jgi:putative tryptophan/tyrosine transport system substrate-binding protein